MESLPRRAKSWFNPQYHKKGKKKKKRGSQIMPVCRLHDSGTIKKLLELMNKFSKVTG
jgi:hypothetical protein